MSSLKPVHIIQEVNYQTSLADTGHGIGEGGVYLRGSQWRVDGGEVTPSAPKRRSSRKLECLPLDHSHGEKRERRFPTRGDMGSTLTETIRTGRHSRVSPAQHKVCQTACIQCPWRAIPMLLKPGFILPSPTVPHFFAAPYKLIGGRAED